MNYPQEWKDYVKEQESKVENWQKKVILHKYVDDISKLEDNIWRLISRINKIMTLEHLGGSTESMRKEKYQLIDKKIKKLKELESLKKKYKETRNKFLGRS